ncbi:hydroxymethylbilane synthase [Propionibacterium cyclohexanicum]|uniref:Hydroxymethylbilane synthase n=1 Tax=Propionibacterium cyclohexanicum TaxID=64702 RepID=A0A1H9SUZ6_9ACTN|nr:hydroxymethylbilane synthase [Propionibacterium cyclohexanicum]SER88708.1 hydroxymethylbilane synthase [Propionibacterium cyclohexanicum]
MRGRTLLIGTRASALAMAQSGLVAAMIEKATGLATELVSVRTEGDDVRIPLSSPPRPGAFAARLRDVLVAGEVDVAVHSFKDLPFAPVEGLSVVAIPPRAVARDALVSRAGIGLDALAEGSRVGTSSPRRAAALTRRRPDLRIVPIRGNVDTRVRKVRDGVVDAAVLAAAGLNRLGRGAEITELIDPAVLVPAPAQGALAVEMRCDHPWAAAVAHLDDPDSRLRVVAERQVLSGVQATCTTAIGAYCQFTGSSLGLIAELSDHRGVEHAHVELRTTLGDDRLGDATRLGERVAAKLMGRA